MLETIKQKIQTMKEKHQEYLQEIEQKQYEKDHPKFPKGFHPKLNVVYCNKEFYTNNTDKKIEVIINDESRSDWYNDSYNGSFKRYETYVDIWLKDNDDNIIEKMEIPIEHLYFTKKIKSSNKIAGYDSASGYGMISTTIYEVFIRKGA